MRSMKYFLIHLDIAMLAIGLIGVYGKIYEPGPVPTLMTIVPCVYFIAGALIYGAYSAWRQSHFSKHKTHSECQIFNLKEDNEWTA